MFTDLVNSRILRVNPIPEVAIIEAKYHLGTNPMRGGMPANDDIFTIVTHDFHLFSIAWVVFFMFMFVIICITIITKAQ
jgi:hypothetical protein